MKPSRPVAAAGAVVLVALIAAVAILFVQADADTDGVDVLTSPDRQARDAAVLAAEGFAATGQAPGALDPGEPEAPGPDGGPTGAGDPGPTWEGRTVAGRVVLADGGAVPEGLWLSASRSSPHPHVGRFDELAAAGQASFDISETTDEDISTPLWRRLEQHTRTEVAPDGSFRMPHVPVGGAFVKVHHETLYVRPAVALRRHTEFVQVVLLRGASISGQITNSDGELLVDVPVRAGVSFDPWSMLDGSRDFVDLETARSDQEGRYALHQVPPGIELRLTARQPRHQPQRATVAALRAGDEHVLDFVLGPGAVVAGRVVDLKRAPVVAAAVRLSPSSFSLADMDSSNLGGKGGPAQGTRAWTDTEGAFLFEGVAEGEYHLALVEGPYRPVRHGPFEVPREGRLDDLELVADPGLAVAGQVVDGTGNPVAAARVQGNLPPSMFDMQANFDREMRSEEDVDAEGRFRLQGFDEGTIQLRARADGFVPLHREVEAGDEDVVLVLEATLDVSGIVVSLTDGEPVTSFEVSLTPSGGLFDMAELMNMEDRIGRTIRPRRVENEEGRFVVGGVQPGSYDLGVRAAGFGQTTVAGVEVEQGRPTRGVVVMLPEAARLMGQVVSARTGIPVADARLSTGGGGLLGVIADATMGTAARARTDAEGRFELVDLGAGAHKLSIMHPDYVSRSVRADALLPGERRDLGLLELSAGSAVYGHVYDERNRPVPAVSVLVAKATGVEFKRTRTGDQGAYRVEGLAPGTYNVMRTDFSLSLSAQSPADLMNDMVLAPVTVGPDEEKRVDLRVDTGEGTVLEGYVTGAAGPVPGVIVTLVPRRGADSLAFGATDQDGFYRLRSMPPGRYVLSAQYLDEGNLSAGSMPVAAVTEEITLGDGPVQRHDMHAPVAGLRGKVVPRRGLTPLSGVRVVIERTDDERTQTPMLEAMNWRTGETYTDETGAFAFPHVAEGTYDVVAGGTNLLGMGDPGPAVTRVSDVEVSGEGPPPLQIQVEDGARVEGDVFDARDQLVSGTTVWARDARGRWLSTLSETGSDQQGHFSLVGLPAGTWTLAFRHPAHALTLVEGLRLRAGEARELEVRLLAGQPLLLDPAPHRADEVHATLSGPAGPVPLHLTSLSEVMQPRAQELLDLGRHAPGTYRLTVTRGAEMLLDTKVVLTPGGEATVVTLAGS